MADVEKPNSYLKNSPIFEEANKKESIYNFTIEISDKIIPLIEKVIASGIPNQFYPINNSSIHMFLANCDEIAKHNLLKALEVEPALDDLTENKITYCSGGNSQLVNAHRVYEWLLTAALKIGALQALSLINKFLLEPNETTTEVLCLDGLLVDYSVDLLPSVKVLTLEELKKLNDYKQIFEGDIGHRPPFRYPTAALVKYFTRPKFICSDVLYKAPVFKWDFDVIMELLTLFGPSAPSVLARFNTSPPSLFINRGIGWSSPYDELFGHEMSKASNLNGFEDLYMHYEKLIGEVKDRAKISITRLNRSLRLGDQTNRALELGIALECILISDKSGTKSEISYRLAHRGAWLLGVDHADRRRKFDILKSAYGLRSAAAHKGKAPEEVKVFSGQTKMATVDLLQIAAELCADAIKKIVVSGNTPNWTDVVLGGPYNADNST